ncbi:tetratricopeptide repeat protein [Lentimicrobium sp.]|jgi:tetratricopeptide (TPR) repeat protein|uniref:tetratricopeptide repeat protein n=1 Tax=Lentimicrobium sp. TaxID=2034841 RepID=UPI0025F6457E|nr:tetratricopeptide repeat protein [Lentimicrobium sp.]MCO5256813.1 tetratricopeptide repeat protein [Lentimicrobium sp.]HPJ61719.1 tetratricopeptide repeat protein [Lentimicrobium sp.]HPR24999.1 tetratricopeptide repeat protein [Lentimicrobium sp.]
MYYNRIIVLILIALFTSRLQAQEPPEGGEDSVSKEDVRLYREQQKARNLFFEANKAKLTGNAEKALTLFSESVNTDPSNDAAWYELAQLYFQKNDPEKSIESARKAYDLYPGNTWYSLTLASLYANNNQPDEARLIYEKLLLSNPQSTEYAIELANIWLQLNKPAEAIKIYDELESRLGVNEDLSMRKHRIYLATGKSKKALEELEKLAGANAWDSRILSMLAEFYLLQGKSDEALATYKKIQDVDPDNAYINISLADYYRQQGDLEKATESLKAGFANPYLDADTKIQVMMSYYSQVKDYDGIEDDVLELSEILAEVHPNDPRALMLRGEMLMMSEKYSEARDLFRKVNELDPGKYQIWENLLRTNAILEDYNQLAAESNAASELFPMQPMPYYFNGYAHYMLKNYESAIQSLSRGVKLVVGDNRLISDFYSMLGDAYHASGNETETFLAYESSLKANGDNALVLNNYAYYLSLSGKNLEKAKEMSEKANRLVPENASYLDTYAWIYYQMGNYDSALIFIEQAIKADSAASAVILEHYGDILFRLGREKEALETWKKARVAGEGSALLEKKLKDGKLYE